MKKLKCFDCEEAFTGETTDSILVLFYGHYMSEHHAIITGASAEEKTNWMKRFHQEWENAENL